MDEFFSNLEGQKIEARALQLEQQSMKKLQNVEKDHANRINQLEKDQDADIGKGQLIELNNDLVEKALTVIRTALANQVCSLSRTFFTGFCKKSQLARDTCYSSGDQFTLLL